MSEGSREGRLLPAGTLGSSCSRTPARSRSIVRRGAWRDSLAHRPGPGPRPLPGEAAALAEPARPASRRWEGAGRPGQTHVSTANPGVGEGELLG